MSIRKDLDTFAFTSAQAVNTLDISLGITQGVKDFVNSISNSAGYVSDSGYYIDRQVSTDGGGAYSKQNITTSTTHVKFTITGAFLEAEDKLPVSFNTNNYELILGTTISSAELSNATVAVVSQPTLTLTNAGNSDRLLTMSNFSVIINFGNTLQNLSTTQRYIYNTAIVHQLSDQYKSIDDIEEEYYTDFPDSPLASY
jgi:hypothetical protein